VQHRPGDEGGWVFPEQREEAEEEVEALEDGDGFDGGVEGLGEEVPEDFGPEDGVEGGGELVWGGGLVVVGRGGEKRGGGVQMAAVRMMRRAQWFLMSLPMVRRGWWSWRWDGGEGGMLG